MTQAVGKMHDESKTSSSSHTDRSKREIPQLIPLSSVPNEPKQSSSSSSTPPVILKVPSFSADPNPPMPALVREDSGKRKRELPQWMNCPKAKKEMSLKKMKTNSLFK